MNNIFDYIRKPFHRLFFMTNGWILPWKSEIMYMYSDVIKKCQNDVVLCNFFITFDEWNSDSVNWRGCFNSASVIQILSRFYRDYRPLCWTLLLVCFIKVNDSSWFRELQGISLRWHSLLFINQVTWPMSVIAIGLQLAKWLPNL